VSDILNVSVFDGKYTYVMRADGTTTALRYGEHWPAFDNSPPDNLHFALASEVDNLRSTQDELLAGLRAAEKALREEGYEDDADAALALLAKHGGAQ